MADNVGYTPGEGAQIAADEIAGVLHQRAKVQFGEDGSATDVSEANPLPVSVGGVSTEETLSALKESVDALNAKIAALEGGRMPVALPAGSSGLTNAELRADPLAVKMDEMIYLLVQVLEKMPRVDGADRILTNASEVAAPVTVSSGTVTTVSNQTNIGGRDASHATFALANMGALHIYDNIRVTA